MARCDPCLSGSHDECNHSLVRACDCLVCREPVRDDGDAVRLARGGYVHVECTTYRMRHHARRPLRRGSRNGHEDFTGE